MAEQQQRQPQEEVQRRRSRRRQDIDVHNDDDNDECYRYSNGSTITSYSDYSVPDATSQQINMKRKKRRHPHMTTSSISSSIDDINEMDEDDARRTMMLPQRRLRSSRTARMSRHRYNHHGRLPNRFMLILLSFLLLGNSQHRSHRDSNNNKSSIGMVVVSAFAMEYAEVGTSFYDDDDDDDDDNIEDIQDDFIVATTSVGDSLSSSSSTRITTSSKPTSDYESTLMSYDEVKGITQPVDILAILPDRTTAYSNGVHNGLLLASKNYNRTLHVIEVGNFNTDMFHVALNVCIQNTIQPQIYVIWPIDIHGSKILMKELHDTHNVPIIQMNQLPTSLVTTNALLSSTTMSPIAGEDNVDEEVEEIESPSSSSSIPSLPIDNSTNTTAATAVASDGWFPTAPTPPTATTNPLGDDGALDEDSDIVDKNENVDNDDDTSYIVAYAGPNDIERASNAGKMMVQAMQERDISQPIILGLGYPISYAGYHVNSNAFRQSIKAESRITLLEILPLERNTQGGIRQNAYDQMVLILDNLIDVLSMPLHGVYAMDDDILLGAYQAIVDRRNQLGSSGSSSTTTSSNDEDQQENQHQQQERPETWLRDITLIGGVCNGARSLLTNGEQYATTLQSPVLESIVAIHTANEYLVSNTGNTVNNSSSSSSTSRTQQPIIRYTPNPVITGDTIQSMVVTFMGEMYVADELCTWNLQYIRSNGLVDKDLPNDICNWVDCYTIPESLIYTANIMVILHVIVAIVCAVVVILYRNKKRIMTLAQPPFLLLVIVGSCIDTSSILFMNENHDSVTSKSSLLTFFRASAQYNDSDGDGHLALLDRNCYTWPWLLTLGQMMTTATLVAKIYRVKVVTDATRRRSTGGGSKRGSFLSRLSIVSHDSGSTNANRFRRASCTDGGSSIRRVTVSARDVSGFIFFGMAVDIVLLTIWFVKHPFRWEIQVVSEDDAGHILAARGTCTSSSAGVDGGSYFIYPTLIVVLHFVLLIYANVLAYQTRHYHQISDSNMVAISLFNSIQLMLVAMIMFALSGDNVTISYVVRVCYAFLNNLGVLALIVVPKVYGSLFGKETTIASRARARISGLNSPYGTASPTGEGICLSPGSTSFSGLNGTMGTVTTGLYSGTGFGSSGGFEMPSPGGGTVTPTSSNKRKSLSGRPSLVDGLLAENTVKLHGIIEEDDGAGDDEEQNHSSSPATTSDAILQAGVVHCVVQAPIHELPSHNALATVGRTLCRDDKDEGCEGEAPSSVIFKEGIIEENRHSNGQSSSIECTDKPAKPGELEGDEESEDEQEVRIHSSVHPCRSPLFVPHRAASWSPKKFSGANSRASLRKAGSLSHVGMAFDGSVDFSDAVQSVMTTTMEDEVVLGNEVDEFSDVDDSSGSMDLNGPTFSRSPIFLTKSSQSPPRKKLSTDTLGIRKKSRLQWYPRMFAENPASSMNGTIASGTFKHDSTPSQQNSTGGIFAEESND